MRTTQTLDLNDARTIIDAGIAEAERIGNPMNIAVVDAGGCLLGSGPIDVRIAI
ncbi:heme-binding protein [uncultured Sphingomonas sp.]|uniref:heme-binding protein n=1 Tax=uncultured Sphingomonas sp. TaxID=158754 RepID=UPI0025EA6030|nr:heme-binding protein [uncultured Sphingomonas sp.]